jgi:nucleoside-diphosphate-sugar epimerase
MSKILITGATGRLGANLTKQLIDRGDEVRALVIPDDPKKSKLDPFDVDLIEGDLRDAELCHKLVEGVDAIVHTANILGPPRGMDNRTYYDINVTGTYNLFEAAAPHADKLHRFVHVSTDAVYPMGNQHIPPCYQPINEIHPKRPSGLYPTLKYMNEAMAEGYMNGYDLQLSIIRPSGMFAGKEVLGRWTVQFVAGRIRDAANKPESGIHSPEGEAIAQDILDRAERPDQPCAITDQEGRPWMWSPSDARDTARACVCALDHPAAVGEAFNAPIYRPLTFPEVAAYLSEKRGIPPLEIEVPMQWVYWSDNTKARTLIGYEPQCTLENIFDTALADEAGEPADVISA